MRSFAVGRNDAGQRLDKFLTKLLKNAPKGMLYKWIRKKRVKVNGKKCEIGYVLCEGDFLELYINDEFFGAEKKAAEYLSGNAEVSVVFEDENILIVDKPSGMKAHDGDDSLLSRICAYLYQKGEYDPQCERTFAPALCNRIDRNTSGLVIAAKNAAALREMNEKLRNRQVRKLYLLRTEKCISPAEGEIRGYVKKDEATRKMKFSFKPFDDAKLCVTKYRALDTEGLIEAELLTGRTHQIRASFAAIGYPLCGDVKYGAGKNGGNTYQELRAYKLIFAFEPSGGVLDELSGKTVEAPK